jgi:hypothetical protein
MPDYEITEPPRHFVSSTFNGWTALPVASSPRFADPVGDA